MPEDVRRERRVERSGERSAVGDHHLLDHAQLIRRDPPQAGALVIVGQHTHFVPEQSKWGFGGAGGGRCTDRLLFVLVQASET